MKTLYKNIKDEFKYNFTSLWQLLVAVFGAWVIGEIISICVIIFTKFKDYISFGSIFVLVCLGFMALFYGFYYFSIALNIALGMSRTRKAYTASIFIVSYLQLILGFVAAIALCFVSNGIHALFFRSLSLEFDFVAFLLQNAHYGFAILLVALIVGMLAGVCVYRYGRTAFWMLWGIWMCLALFGSKLVTIVSERDTSTFIGSIACGIADRIPAFSLSVWILIGCVCVAIIFLVAVQLLRRATVKQ